jgi:hypothetical protein
VKLLKVVVEEEVHTTTMLAGMVMEVMQVIQLEVKDLVEVVTVMVLIKQEALVVEEVVVVIE